MHDVNQAECEIIDTNIFSRKLKLFWRTRAEDIPRLISAGVVPIEMAEANTSYVDEMVLDHHNQYSHMPAACRIAMNFYGTLGQKNETCMLMVNHVDLDCVLTGAILLGILDNAESLGKPCERLARYAAMDDTDPLNPTLSQDRSQYEAQIVRT